EIREGVGAPQELRFEKEGRRVEMKFRVEALEPGRRVAWVCTANDNPAWLDTWLTWEIEPTASGSVLRFRHEGFTQGGPLYDRTVQGWEHFVASLKAYVESGRGAPW